MSSERVLIDLSCLPDDLYYAKTKIHMVETKLFEVRDRLTFISVIAIELASENREENFLLRKVGYRPPGTYIIVGRLGQPNNLKVYPSDWDVQAGRTMGEAHKYIVQNWNKLDSGDVIDIEYILKETETPKISERIEPIL